MSSSGKESAATPLRSQRSRPPLLTFPPSSPPRPNTLTFPLPRTPLNRTLAFTPLLFILSILLFSFYAFFLSLTLHHLLYERGEWVRAGAYGAVFLWLWSGTLGSVGMAWWVGGGRVGGKRKDEEKGKEGAPLLGEEEDEEGVGEVKVERMRGRGGRKGVRREEEGGIDFGEAMRELEEEDESGERRERVQVKSDGGGRFCRKVSLLWRRWEGARMVLMQRGVQCQLDKPDRAHHCSSCGYCVLKMDQCVVQLVLCESLADTTISHCPWLGGGCVVGRRCEQSRLRTFWI